MLTEGLHSNAPEIWLALWQGVLLIGPMVHIVKKANSTIHRATLVLLSLIGPSLQAQPAPADRLRDLIQAVSHLPVDRVELTVHPPLPLEGISAVVRPTSDVSWLGDLRWRALH